MTKEMLIVNGVEFRRIDTDIGKRKRAARRIRRPLCAKNTISTRMKNLVKDINQLISLNLMKEAFKKLGKQAVPQEFQEELVLLNSRFNNNERERNILGVLSHDVYLEERNEIQKGLMQLTEKILQYITFVEETFYLSIENQSSANGVKSNVEFILKYKDAIKRISFKSTWNKKKVFIENRLILEKIGIFNPFQLMEFFVEFDEDRFPTKLFVRFDFWFGGISKIKFVINEITILETGLDAF